RIGAAATYTDMLPHFARFGESAVTLLRRLGSTQIRNLGTMGGNIANASPIGDTPPLLMALGASVEIDGVNGPRVVRIEDMFTAYRKTVLQQGEYIAAISLPWLGDDEIFYTEKVSRRFDQDISAVCGAFWLKREGGAIVQARIAYGGMAARPERAQKAEAALAGAAFAASAFEHAAQALSDSFKPISDFRASADYRMRTAQNLLRRLTIIARAPAGSTA
ncbi:MAG: xanthine dehydrogenase small subunit, partial [Alphaproteobacteria bacterium]|nr:xanthine dehydrogenase small subunit [Alphaproteobacteria bacterium]